MSLKPLIAGMSQASAGSGGGGDNPPFIIQVACSDLVTDITTGTGKAVFRMPAAMTLSEVRASCNIAPTGSAIQIDINGATGSLLSTPLTIPSSGKYAPLSGDGTAVISDFDLADNEEVTIDFDQVGSLTPGAGVIITLIGTYT